MRTQTQQADRFLALHRPAQPLLLPNPWDPGTAKILASLGFEALATTSSGHAATSGRLDGSVTREEAISHAAAIVAATELPVSADLENCFADDPDGVAQTIRLALAAGVAGCSIEDHTRRDEAPIYDLPQAVERVEAAAEAAHGGTVHLVLTARAENYLHGRPDLADTIARLQAYQEAGADVLYAPGLSRLEDIRALVSSIDRPVNVLAFPGAPPVATLAEIGVSRVSSAAPLPTPPSPDSSRRRANCAQTAPTGSWSAPRSVRAPRAPRFAADRRYSSDGPIRTMPSGSSTRSSGAAGTSSSAPPHCGHGIAWSTSAGARLVNSRAPHSQQRISRSASMN